MVINEVISLYPWTLPVFHRLDVDSCCGGARTIEAMAREHGLDPMKSWLNYRQRRMPARAENRLRQRASPANESGGRARPGNARQQAMFNQITNGLPRGRRKEAL